MRVRFTDSIPQKPSVCDIHLHIRYRLPQGADSVQVLYQYDLEQYHRIYTGTAVILTIQLAHDLIYPIKIHCGVDLA